MAKTKAVELSPTRTRPPEEPDALAASRLHQTAEAAGVALMKLVEGNKRMHAEAVAKLTADSVKMFDKVRGQFLILRTADEVIIVDKGVQPVDEEDTTKPIPPRALILDRNLRVVGRGTPLGLINTDFDPMLGYLGEVELDILAGKPVIKRGGGEIRSSGLKPMPTHPGNKGTAVNDSFVMLGIQDIPATGDIWQMKTDLVSLHITKPVTEETQLNFEGLGGGTRMNYTDATREIERALRAVMDRQIRRNLPEPAPKTPAGRPNPVTPNIREVLDAYATLADDAAHRRDFPTARLRFSV